MNSNLKIYEATSSKPLTVSSKNMGAHTMHTWLWQQDYVARWKSSPTTHTFWTVMSASMYSPWNILQRSQGWDGISNFVFRHKFRCRQGWVGRHSVKVEKPIPQIPLSRLFLPHIFPETDAGLQYVFVKQMHNAHIQEGWQAMSKLFTPEQTCRSFLGCGDEGFFLYEKCYMFFWNTRFIIWLSL
jgi:hypothetical protein